MTRVKDLVSFFLPRIDKNNDISDFSSRLVFRTAGTQRVALNTQIWGGMSVEQCTKKVNIFMYHYRLVIRAIQSIRISAQDTSTDDDNEVGVFLIQCGVEQSKQLYQALSYRISQVSDFKLFDENIKINFRLNKRKKSSIATNAKSAPFCIWYSFGCRYYALFNDHFRYNVPETKRN